MRKVTDGNGADSTSAALSYLTTNRKLWLADLYVIGEIGDPMAIYLTNFETPLNYKPIGTFTPAVIERGQVSSKVGLEVATMDVTWWPPVTTLTSSISAGSPLQLFQLGVYDNWRFRVYKVFMPTPGDCNTLGVTPLFGGRISEVTGDRISVQMTIRSYLEVVDQKIPPNTIENTNSVAAFGGAKPPAGFSKVPTFQVFGFKSNNIFYLDCTSTPGHIFSDHVFRNGWLQFDYGAGETLSGMWSVVGDNVLYIDGDLVHHNQVTIYSPMPWPPTPLVDTCFISAPQPSDQSEGVIGVDNKPFPYVPPPESAG